MCEGVARRSPQRTDTEAASHSSALHCVRVLTPREASESECIPLCSFGLVVEVKLR